MTIISNSFVPDCGHLLSKYTISTLQFTNIADNQHGCECMKKFSRFNRIVMRSLHVNANRYVNIFVFCFVYFAWGFSFDSNVKLQNFSDIGYVLQHDGLQAAYIGEQKDAI